jgi:predicted nucleic acid-binding protein
VIVVDASAMVALLMRTSAAPAIEARLFGGRQTFHAPELIDVEVTQVLRRYSIAGQLDSERGRTVMSDLMDFPMRRHPHGVLMQRVWELRHNLSALRCGLSGLGRVSRRSVADR